MTKRATMITRFAMVAATAVTLGLAAPSAAGAFPREGGIPACPAPAELVAHFSKGVEKLATAGDLSKGEAQSAKRQFADWLDANPEAPCAIRDGMVRNGVAFLAFIGMTPAELRAAYLDGQSLSEMAKANGISEKELETFLNDQVDEGLDAFVKAGAFDGTVRDAIDGKAEEMISFGVDYHKGDPLPEGHGEA